MADKVPVSEIAFKLLLTVQDVVALTSIPENTITTAIKRGELRAKWIGQKHRILPEHLREWLERQPDATEQRPSRIIPTRAVRRAEA